VVGPVESVVRVEFVAPAAVGFAEPELLVELVVFVYLFDYFLAFFSFKRFEVSIANPTMLTSKVRRSFT